MAEHRYITVTLADGVTVASVRVISLHPDDDALREQRYKAEDYWEQCDALDSLLRGSKYDSGNAVGVWVNEPLLDPEKVEKALTLTSALKLKRDKALRELVTLVLKDKHPTDATELLKLCPIVQTLRIWRATAGEDVDGAIARVEASQKARDDIMLEIWKQECRERLKPLAASLTPVPPADTSPPVV